ncbi:MAG TPA: mannose-1-phosphate guanylyltransferase/mannose-6-phosphate isomerase [Gammaproteobacteria bacterium]
MTAWRATGENPVPVILAGGRGTRLWPVSREARPKPFLKMAHGRSLLQETLLRAAAIRPDIVIATRDDYYFQTDEDVAGIRDQLGRADIHYLLEPEVRGTGPAIAMAARHVRERHGEDALLLVLPSDHLIDDTAAFREAVERAALAAAGGDLVALGVQPTEPATAFGYIESQSVEAQPGVRKARRFVEKPCRADAEHFLATGQYDWNSGIFCFSVKSVETAFAKYMPEISAQVESVWRSRRHPAKLPHALRFGGDAFAAMPETSIDYAVMEKADNVAVVRADMEWRDVGSWETMVRLGQPDADGNKVSGQAVLINARNNYVQADGRLVAAVGVEGLVIVDTPDALLVGAQAGLQDVGQVADRLRGDGHEAGLVHRTVHRPWGTYTVISEGEGHKIKRLCVKPGAALSLQLHRYRTEHWVVVQGEALVTSNDTTLRLARHESIIIPAGCRHRIENRGREDVVIIETQTGSYLGEDDIVRIEDHYGRTAH